MDKSQYEALKGAPVTVPMAKAEALLDNTPRTLIYGYTCARETFHVYLAEDGVHRVVYDPQGVLVEHHSESDGIPLAECVPNKRVYPAACDYDFCTLLRQADVTIPFTTWEDRPEKPFYGRVLSELVTKYRTSDFELSLQHFMQMAYDLFDNTFIEVDAVTQVAAQTHSVAQAYLRARVLGNDAQPERWLSGLPGSLDQAVKSVNADISLPKELLALAVTRVRALVQPRLAELLARA